MNKAWGALLAVVALTAACAVQTSVIRSGYDFSAIKRVAILDFNDAPYRPGSGAMTADLFVKHFLKTGLSVVERAQLDSLLQEQTLAKAGVLDPAQVKRAGRISGVDAFITGTVTTFIPEQDFIENGNPRFIAAQIGVTCRMISVETGEVLWSGSGSYDGMDTQVASEYLAASLVAQFQQDIRAK